jgi:glutathione synthase/RimK-type ligase-like ATP-grasp enzyme
MHRNKGFQLRLLAEAGIRVPRTLVTNAPESVRAFFEQENGNVIYKPVLGGAHTTRLLAEDLTDERLAALASSPVQFQEFIPGDNIRVYGIGEELFAGNIIAETIDFRDDANARIERVDLPDDVAQQCRTLMRLFGLVLTGIDIRRSPEGEYVFLEGNPSPMFLHFEAMTGYPIGDRLVDLLLGGKSG